MLVNLGEFDKAMALCYYLEFLAKTIMSTYFTIMLHKRGSFSAPRGNVIWSDFKAELDIKSMNFSYYYTFISCKNLYYLKYQNKYEQAILIPTFTNFPQL